MSWYSDFKSFTDNSFHLKLRENKLKILDSEKKAEHNRWEFLSASSIINSLEDFEKMTGFYRSISQFFSKSLHIHFNPSQNLSTILFLNGSVMVTIVFQKIKCKGVLALNIAYFLHALNISNIPRHKKSLNSTFFISEFRFDQVHGKMLDDT